MITFFNFRKLALAAIAVVGASTILVYAADVTPETTRYHSMCVEFTDGTEALFDISDPLTIHFDGEQMSISHADKTPEATYAVMDVTALRYTPTLAAGTTTVQMPVLQFTPVAITICGIADTAPVMLYDTAGRMVISSRGPQTISTEALSAGIYMLRAGSYTFKFAIRL